MIQLCSRCGTQWNVRDRRRAWCPRCNGALWAPLTPAQEAELQWAAPAQPGPPAPPPAPTAQSSPPPLGTGYRWIAVRPGPPPPQRHRARPLGPTPRYSVMPRWTLMGVLNSAAAQQKSGERPAPSPRSLAKALGGATAALGIAALVQALIYVLMIINRTRLLHPLVAGGAVWLSRLAGLAAIAAVVYCAVVLTSWLIARRAATFARLHLPESREAWALWTGCLLPLVNLAWAPVYLLELAGREERLARLRTPIVVWWLVWAASTAAAIFATATSWAGDAQGIANNTVATLVAYLAGLAAVVTAAKVVEGFEQRSLARPAHHWVVVADDSNTAAPVPPEDPEEARGPGRSATPAAVLESEGREPAA